ncbi:MAG: carboxypeptidase regulatory-like domain-containing protein [Acidobacteriaceae bacterium]|nr:carboxypeptidase regulatory-like domain-containing protein [Acidobacteriaceae bacterium]
MQRAPKGLSCCRTAWEKPLTSVRRRRSCPRKVLASWEGKTLRRIAIILAFACALQAQEFRSTLTVKATDPSSAAVPNATVVAIKSDTNARFPTVSGADGTYTIPFLPPGPYGLTAEAKGFKKYEQSGIHVASDVKIAQDITLSVGGATESVIAF